MSKQKLETLDIQVPVLFCSPIVIVGSYVLVVLHSFRVGSYVVLELVVM